MLGNSRPGRSVAQAVARLVRNREGAMFLISVHRV